MPNHCSNRLVITGDPDAVLAFQALAQDGADLDFTQSAVRSLFSTSHSSTRKFNDGRMMPRCPAIMLSQPLPHLYDVETVWLDSNTLRYEFETARDPPKSWLASACETATGAAIKAELTFGEHGMDFSGIMTYENGELVHTADRTFEEFWQEEVPGEDREVVTTPMEED